MKKQFKKGDKCYIIDTDTNMIISGIVSDYHTLKIAQKKWLANRKDRKKLYGIGYGWPDQDMVQVSYFVNESLITCWIEVDSVKKDPQDFLLFINQ
jgi:hypothetical protein